MFVFEETAEGWLIDDPISFGAPWHAKITVASGKYYIKAESRDTDNEHYVTGEVAVSPFVTTYVRLELE